MRRLLLLLVVLAGCGKAVPPYEGRTVEDLRRQLGEADANRQAQAATGLSLHGAAALPALPELVPLLKGESPLARQQAALALGAIGPEAADAVGPLTQVLSDPEWAVRRQAALALGKLGPSAKTALPTLRKLSQGDANGLVKKAAQEAASTLDKAR